MNTDSLQSLVIAKTLLDKSLPLCTCGNRYDATAGLILLQDSIEAFLYSALIELSKDDAVRNEKKSFEEMLGEFKLKGIVVKNSHTLKIINKQRVLAKHYAQIMEPTAVMQFYQIAFASIEDLMISVFSIGIQDITITEILTECEAKKMLTNASKLISQDKYLAALLEIRKAIFLEFEWEYNIYDWRNYDEKTDASPFLSISYIGKKCPAYKRNKQWIEKNVDSPTDYIQMDHDTFRFTALEYGFSFEEYLNIERFTPKVFRNSPDEPWNIEFTPTQIAESQNRSVALYCLDKATLILSRKQQYHSQMKPYSEFMAITLADSCIGKAVYQKPDKESGIVGYIDVPCEFITVKSMTGFDGLWYDSVFRFKTDSKRLFGYIIADEVIR